MYVQEKKGVLEKIANKKYEKRQQKIEMMSCLSKKFFFYYLAIFLTFVLNVRYTFKAIIQYMLIFFKQTFMTVI